MIMNTNTNTKTKAAAPETPQEHTARTLSALIQSRWEIDLPEKVLDSLRPLNGKAITTRLLDKMPGGKEKWYLIRHYGWTSLRNNSYRIGDYENGMEIMLARSETSVPLDVAWV